jgi:alcohol dehydrogenase (cytochrome c)
MAAARFQVCLVFAGLLIWFMPARAQVTYERVLNASREPQNWLTYSGDYKSWRYSTVDQINISNVNHLAARWVFQSASLGQF